MRRLYSRSKSRSQLFKTLSIFYHRTNVIKDGSTPMLLTEALGQGFPYVARRETMALGKASIPALPPWHPNSCCLYKSAIWMNWWDILFELKEQNNEFLSELAYSVLQNVLLSLYNYFQKKSHEHKNIGTWGHLWDKLVNRFNIE